MKSQSGGDPKSMTPQIEKLDKKIQGLGGSFFGQQIVDITDLLLGPRLNAMEVMLKKQGVCPGPACRWHTMLWLLMIHMFMLPVSLLDQLLLHASDTLAGSGSTFSSCTWLGHPGITHHNNVRR